MSALYSIAEQVRQEADPAEPVPDFGNGVPARGAASPESAVREAVAAAADLNVRRLIELTPADEMAVLHDYGPMLVDAAERSRDDDFQGPSVNELDLAVADGPDGTKVVSATRFEVIDADEYGSTIWAYDGSCTSITSEYDYDYDSESFEPEGELLEAESEAGSDVFEVCDDDGQTAFAPYFLFSGYGAGGLVRVVTEQHDGQWFVSPSRSIVESVLGGLRELSVEEVRRTARVWAGDYWAAEPDGFWEACGVERPADDAPSDEGEQAAEECYETLPDDYEGEPFGWYGGGYSDESGDGDGFGDDGSYQYDPVDDPSYACYDLGDDAATESCLADLVDSGDIDPGELASFRCDQVYDAIPSDADDATREAADEAYGECYDAFVEGDGSTVASSAPPPILPPGSPGPTGPSETAPASAPATTSGAPGG